MTDNAKKILDSMLAELTAEKAIEFVRERVFSDGINIPCKNWSFLNQFIVFLSGSSDARGYLQWKEAGRVVKKGAKAIYILVPMIYKTKKKDDDEEKEDEKRLAGFKAMPVFRVEDTEGDELDYVIKMREFDPESLPLIEVARSLGIKVSAGLTGEAAGWYRPYDNSITMGSNNGQTFLHELSHAIDQVLPGRKTDPALNEVIAELSAAFLCKLYGFDCDVDNANAYIRGWAGRSQTAFEFAQAMERVEEIYAYIADVKVNLAA